MKVFLCIFTLALLAGLAIPENCVGHDISSCNVTQCIKSRKICEEDVCTCDVTVSIRQEEKWMELTNCEAMGPVVSSLVLAIIFCVGALVHKKRKAWIGKKKAEKSEAGDINITSNFDAERHVYRTEKVEMNLPTTDAGLLQKVNNLQKIPDQV